MTCCFSLSLCLIFWCTNEGYASYVSSQIEAGFVGGQKIFTDLKNGNIIGIVDDANLTTVVERYFYSTAHFYKAIKNKQLSPQETDHLLIMFAHARKTLARHPPLFQQVSKDVTWHLENLDMAHINTVLNSLNSLLTFAMIPSDGIMDTWQNFRSSYEKMSSRNTTGRLYDAMVRASGENESSILYRALHDIGNDRRLLHQLLSGVVQILIRAEQFELLYSSSLGDTDIVVRRLTTMSREIKRIAHVVLNLDTIVRNRAARQVRKDVELVCITSHAHTNREIVREIRKLVKEKYYWRTWFTLAFNGVSTDKYAVFARDWDVTLRCGGRTLIVANAEIDYIPINKVIQKKRFSSIEHWGISLKKPRGLLTRYIDTFGDINDLGIQLVVFVPPDSDMWFKVKKDLAHYQRITRSGLFWSEKIDAIAFG